jgi:hypothetical protein
MEEAQKEEALIQKALKTAQAEAARATAEQRTALEQQIQSLNAKLAEAEAKTNGLYQWLSKRGREPCT